MSLVRCHIAVSLDGFAAGPDQSEEHPLGRGGERLHEWMFTSRTWHAQHGRDEGERDASDEVVEAVQNGIGAYVMGRNMFGWGRGAWDESWRGWWGDDPPFHQPVFVLTHNEREPVPMRGGTTFFFVTDGIEAALSKARYVAGDKDVTVAGGASTVRQFLAAGLLDELYLHIVPVMLGAGERLLEDVGEPSLEQIEVVPAPGVTHVKYRVLR